MRKVNYLLHETTVFFLFLVFNIYTHRHEYRWRFSFSRSLVKDFRKQWIFIKLLGVFECHTKVRHKKKLYSGRDKNSSRCNKLQNNPAFLE